MYKVKVFGGLGNQMFQYALSQYLKTHGRQARICFSNFTHIGYHQGFDLGRAFNLELPFWQDVFRNGLLRFESLFRIRYLGFPLRRLGKSVHERNRVKIFEKQHFAFDPELLQSPPGLLVGIWQHHAYLEGLRETLLSHFTFKTPTDPANRKAINLIRSTNSVSIHIRRGDYLNPEWRDNFSFLSDLAYYRKAIARIEKEVKDPTYFIFSDDPKWVRENLVVPNAHYINHNQGRKSYLDMYLMSLCRHNIIANSTFSWWGAWLNRNESKTVIMPTPWLKNTDCHGVYHPGWTPVDALEKNH